MSRPTVPSRVHALEDAIEIRSCELLLDRMVPWIAHHLGMSVEQAQPVRDAIERDVFPPMGVSLDTWKRTHLQPLSELALEQGNELMVEFSDWEASSGAAPGTHPWRSLAPDPDEAA